MIQSFADEVAQKLFQGVALNKKERKALGSLNIDKAAARLAVLDRADEKALHSLPSLKYQKLHGTKPQRYSIDADARNSPWRITFAWIDDELKDVKLVRVEDTH